MRLDYLNDRNGLQDPQSDQDTKYADARSDEQYPNDAPPKTRRPPSDQSQDQVGEADVLRHQGHRLRRRLPLLLHVLQVLFLLG